jgi:hypothetical protein
MPSRHGGLRSCAPCFRRRRNRRNRRFHSAWRKSGCSGVIRICAVACRRALLANGAIIAQGAPREVMRPVLIEQCYGFTVRMLDAGRDHAPVAVPA